MAAEKPKRRLPVIRSSPVGSAEEEAEQRPPWQWVLIGAIAAILGWLLLAMLANLLLASTASAGAAGPARWVAVTVHAVGFAVASFGAGCLVGRLGTSATRRQSTQAGALAALLGVAMTLISSSGLRGVGDVLAWTFVLVVMVALGGGAATLGDRVGRKRSSAHD